MSTVHLKASLVGQPACWREIEVPTTVSLATLARGIIESFGFSFDHAFGFYSDLGDHYQRLTHALRGIRRYGRCR